MPEETEVKPLESSSEVLTPTVKVSDTDAILDAIKELTTAVADCAKEVKEMKERHDKWIKAGKF